MRLRNIPGAKEEMLVNPYVIRDPETRKGSWKQEVFGNGRPLYVEIGCGKGRFLCQMAEEHPEVSFIGIEKFSSVLLRALQKRAAMEADNLNNLRFDAEGLTEIFGPGEVDRIYLNFSDPWPKDKNANKRLTSPVFLKLYDKILRKDGVIEFKTDNRGLFDYSVETLPASGWKIQQITYDLHNDAGMNEGNVMTEYEAKFSAKGNPIFKLIAAR